MMDLNNGFVYQAFHRFQPGTFLMATSSGRIFGVDARTHQVRYNMYLNEFNLLILCKEQITVFD